MQQRHRQRGLRPALARARSPLRRPADTALTMTGAAPLHRLIADARPWAARSRHSSEGISRRIATSTCRALVPAREAAVVGAHDRDRLAQQRVPQLLAIALRGHPPGRAQQRLAPGQRLLLAIVLLAQLGRGPLQRRCHPVEGGPDPPDLVGAVQLANDAPDPPDDQRSAATPSRRSRSTVRRQSATSTRPDRWRCATCASAIVQATAVDRIEHGRERHMDHHAHGASASRCQAWRYSRAIGCDAREADAPQRGSPQAAPAERRTAERGRAPSSRPAPAPRADRPAPLCCRAAAADPPGRSRCRTVLSPTTVSPRRVRDPLVVDRHGDRQDRVAGRQRQQRLRRHADRAGRRPPPARTRGRPGWAG